MLLQKVSYISFLFAAVVSLCSTTPVSGETTYQDSKSETQAISSQAYNQSVRSGKKAFLLSLILPGAGQYYMGERKRAQFFAGSEVAIWLGYGGFHKYEDWRSKDYRLFSIVHAGVKPTGKSDDYFNDIGFYSSIYEFNKTAILNDGPQAKLYPENKVWIWEWDREQSRLKYRLLRNSRLNAHQRMVFMVGFALANHIVSAIDAARIPQRKAAIKPEREGFLDRFQIICGESFLGFYTKF